VALHNELNPLIFLGPDPHILESWGALNPWKIKYNYQVWRLFTALFLNVGLSMYLFSSIALLVIGFMAENHKISPRRMALFYFLSGILGNFLSACL